MLQRKEALSPIGATRMLPFGSAKTEDYNPVCHLATTSPLKLLELGNSRSRCQELVSSAHLFEACVSSIFLYVDLLKAPIILAHGEPTLTTLF